MSATYGRPNSATAGGGVGRGIDGDGFAMFTAPTYRTPTAPPRNKHVTATATRALPVSATRSTENSRAVDVTDGTIRSDPGARLTYETGSSDVCFDEKVLKQIR